jgi:hypothetical protein
MNGDLALYPSRDRGQPQRPQTLCASGGRRGIGASLSNNRIRSHSDDQVSMSARSGCVPLIRERKERPSRGVVVGSRAPDVFWGWIRLVFQRSCVCSVVTSLTRLAALSVSRFVRCHCSPPGGRDRIVTWRRLVKRSGSKAL